MAQAQQNHCSMELYKNTIVEDMERQKCIIECFHTIKKHMFQFHNRNPSDEQLSNILGQLIERFERDEDS